MVMHFLFLQGGCYPASNYIDHMSLPLVSFRVSNTSKTITVHKKQFPSSHGAHKVLKAIEVLKVHSHPSMLSGQKGERRRPKGGWVESGGGTSLSGSIQTSTLVSRVGDI